MIGIEVDYKNITKEEEKVIDWICEFRDGLEKNYRDKYDINNVFLEIYQNLRKVDLDQKILHLYMFHCKDVVEASEIFKKNGDWETIYESSGRFIETMIEISIAKFGLPRSDKEFVRLITQFHTVYKDGRKQFFYYIGFSTIILFINLRLEKSYLKRIKRIDGNYFSQKFLDQWKWFLDNLRKPEVKKLLGRWNYKIRDINIKKDITDLIEKLE